MLEELEGRGVSSFRTALTQVENSVNSFLSANGLTLTQQQFDALLAAHHGQVIDSSLSRDEGYLRMEITVRLEPPITHDEALAFIKANSGVRRVSV